MGMHLRRRVSLAAIVGLAVTATAWADMVPTSELDVARRQSVNVCACSAWQSTTVFPSHTRLGIAGHGFAPFSPLPVAKTDVGQSGQTHSLQLVTDGQGSLSLCLYALVGLGLCSAPHWAKRLSFGHIPEWYHSGGPFQIGHSLAVTPESLRSGPVCCFVQPDCATGQPQLAYHRGTIAPLLRKSLLTPNTLAARGPPLR